MQREELSAMETSKGGNMSWSIGFDRQWNRDIGYGVPAECDHPDCHEKIDRGLAYVCGGEPYGGARGCGLYFCREHLGADSLCERCVDGLGWFEKKPDTKEWIHHKLTDETWAKWRLEHADEVARMEKLVERNIDVELAARSIRDTARRLNDGRG